MDECLQLKDEIELLICQGNLARFVTERPPQPRSIETKLAAWENVDNRPIMETIHTVSGGPPSTSSSGNQPEKPQSKRARTEDVTTFIDADL